MNVKVRQKDCNFKKLWRKSIFMHIWVLRNGVCLVYLILMFKTGKKGSPLLMLVFAYVSVTHACDAYVALHMCHTAHCWPPFGISTCTLTFRRLKSASLTGSSGWILWFIWNLIQSTNTYRASTLWQSQHSSQFTTLKKKND